MSLDNYKSHTGLRTRPEYKRKAVYTLHEDANGKYGAQKLGKNGADVDLEIIREVTKSPADYATTDADKAAAFSLRKVSDKPNADQVIFNSADNLIQGSISTNIQTGNEVPIESVHTGLVYRTFSNISTASDQSIVFQDNLIRIKANNPGTGLQAYTQVLRFSGLGTLPNATYTIKGEARVVGIDVAGTNVTAQAYFDIQDGNGGVGVITSSEFQPFSITHKTTLPTENFIDLACRISSTSNATDLTGFATAEYRNIQIIKNPTQVVKIRRGDQIEADVFVDSEGNTSVNSPIQNTVEHINPPTGGTAYDTHFTPEKTLGKFLQSKETNAITIASTYQSSAESFSVSDNGFSVKVLDDVSGQPNNTVRFCRAIDSTIREYDSKVTKFTVSFNVTDFEYSGGGTAATVKGSNNTIGSSSWFFVNKDGTGLGTAVNITGKGAYSFVGYGKLDNVNNTDGTFNFDFRSLVFIAQQGLKMTVENIQLTIDHAAAVPCWYDQVLHLNNGNHAVQTDEQKQPYLAKYGEVLTDGGRATIEFPNTATNAYYKLVAPAPLQNLNDCSIYAVSSTKSTNTLGALTYSQIFTHGSYTNNERFYIAKRQNFPNWYVGYGDGFHDSGVAIVANKQHIFSIHGGASEMSAHIDGVEVLRQASENNDLQATQVVIGQHTVNNNDAAYDGNISEIIYYRTDLSNVAPYIEGNLAAYYGNVDVPRTMAAIRGVSGSGGNNTAKILLGIYLDKYEEAVNGEVHFKYWVPSGHAAVGKYWHIGASSQTHTGTASEPIVGGQWTEATVSFGSLFSGLDKSGTGAIPNRFLIISSQRKPANVLSGTITQITANEDLLLSDIVVYSISDFTSQTDLDSKTEGGYTKPNYTYAHN